MFCTRCAKLNPPSVSRCLSCGAHLNEASSGRKRRQPEGRQHWLLLLPFALAIGVAGMVGWRAWTVHQAQSTAYELALAALSNGDLPEAIAQFGQAGSYHDAQAQRITTQQQLAPYQAALLDAQTALDRKENRQAVTLLRTVLTAMPTNETARQLLATAEERFRADLNRDLSIAKTNRDWLQVERLTLQLAYWDQTEPDADALAALRLEHAPVLFTRNGVLSQIGPDLADEELIFSQMPASAPLWSPDRSQIAFFSTVPGSTRFGSLFVIDAHGGDLRLIAAVAVLSPAAWSPDGRQLVYVAPSATNGSDDSTELRFADLSDQSERTLAAPAGFSRLISPSWSGDGAKLTAIALGQKGASSILIVDASSLEARPLLDTTPNDARAVAWSPSAEMLLLWTTNSDSDWFALRGSMVYLVSIADKSILPVTTATQAPSRPVWAPDGIHFAYLDRGATLHVRIRTGIGDRTLELPKKGNGVISWGPGGVGIMVPALDLADPSMLVPVGERLGPVEPVVLPFDGGLPATDFQWGPITVPDPALYDPLATPQPTG